MCAFLDILEHPCYLRDAVKLAVDKIAVAELIVYDKVVSGILKPHRQNKRHQISVYIRQRRQAVIIIASVASQLLALKRAELFNVIIVDRHFVRRHRLIECLCMIHKCIEIHYLKMVFIESELRHEDNFERADAYKICKRSRYCNDDDALRRRSFENDGHGFVNQHSGKRKAHKGKQ